VLHINTTQGTSCIEQKLTMRCTAVEGIVLAPGCINAIDWGYTHTGQPYDTNVLRAAGGSQGLIMGKDGLIYILALSQSWTTTVAEEDN
jgi:hypothetical protein